MATLASEGAPLFGQAPTLSNRMGDAARDKVRQAAMQNLPIFLEMRDRTAVVVGGGVVAARRAEFLVRCGAHVTAFAPELGEDFLELRHRPNFRHVARNPGPEDFEGSTLCFIATEDQGLAEEARSAAQAAGALVNVADQPRLCDFIMPSIVDRSPLVIAISTGGASPILGRMLKARLETQIPAAYGRLAHLMSGFRQRVAEVMPSQTTRRRFWETVLEGPIGEAALTGNERAAGAHLAREIEHVREHADLVPRGEVYLVGAGPGDPDLVTFRALRLMQKADVVLYDRLIGEGVMNLVRREAERIYVGKRPDDHELPQEEIGALLVRLALEGKRVLRLKGGDPFMFGRGGEEIETLAAHGVPFQVCPGVTAAIGASAYAGIPLTHRDHAQACVFVTGHGRDGKIDLDWTTLLQPRQTVAIYMGLRNLQALTEEFVARGASADLPAAIIDNATRVNQKVVMGTLRTLAAEARAAELRGPSIVIVGTVVALRDKLDWYAPAALNAEQAVKTAVNDKN
ncbi:MAG: siroheme synthase CysG [Roseiarcus sp.]